MPLTKVQSRGTQNVGAGSPNLVINGAMQVHQRTGTITLGTGLTTTLDRMTFYKSHGGTNTVEQSTDAPEGFANSLKAITTVADSSVSATDRVSLIYRMEGLDASRLEFGTSNAQTITISFYVRSSITGTHGGAVGNGSDNRAYPFTYTISSADTWERKSITVAGDTSGTWATTNARSLQVAWGLGVGSTFSGTAGAWESADRNSATGATTGVLTTANATWYITGIQIEIGSQASDFQHEDFGTTLGKCQRYHLITDFNIQGYPSSSGYAHCQVNFPVQMRANPSASITDGSKGSVSSTATSAHNITKTGCRVENQTTGNLSRMYHLGGTLTLSAEL